MVVTREDKLRRLRGEIAQGTHRVDPIAVADAIVRRLQEKAQAGGTHLAARRLAGSGVGADQNECS